MMQTLVDALAGTGREMLLGLLAGLNVYSISRLYYWRRAKIHYLAAIAVILGYIVLVTYESAIYRELFLVGVLLFCTFYAYRRIRVIAAFEQRTGIRVRQSKFSAKELLDTENIEPYHDTLTGGEESAQQIEDREAQ